MAQVARLNIDLVARTGGLTKGFNTAKGSVKGFAASTKASAIGVAALGGASRAATGAVGALVASMGPLIAAGLAFVGIAKTIGGIKTEFGDVDEIAKTSAAIGVTTEKLAGLQFAAKLGGLSNEKMNKSLIRMTKAVADANNKLSTQVRAFDAIGVSLDELDGLSPDQILSKIADSLSGVEDNTTKVAAAMDIFGRSGAGMLNVLRGGSDGLKEMQMRAEKLGITFNSFDAAKIEQANDAITSMKEVFKGFFRLVAIELAPFVTAFADKISDLGTRGAGAGGFIANAFGFVGESIAVVADVVDTVILAFKRAQLAIVEFQAFSAIAFIPLFEAVEKITGFIVKGFNIAFNAVIAAADRMNAKILGVTAGVAAKFEEIAPEAASGLAELFQDTRIAKGDQLNLTELTSGVAEGASRRSVESIKKFQAAIKAERPDFGIDQFGKDLASSIEQSALLARKKFDADFIAPTLGEKIRDGIRDIQARADKAARGLGDGQDADEDVTQVKTPSLAPAALQKGSVAAFSAILKAGKATTKTPAEIEQIAEQKRQTKLLQKIDESLSNPPEVLSIA